MIYAILGLLVIVCLLTFRVRELEKRNKELAKLLDRAVTRYYALHRAQREGRTHADESGNGGE